MIRKAPGKAHREGVSVVEIMRMFPDNETAEAWFVGKRWPDGAHCPFCGSLNIQTGAKHVMPYRCRERECRKRFSTRTGTVMQGSNLDYQTWAVAICLSLTSLKSVSSMKLHRDLKVTQKTAWHLAHRLRTAYARDGAAFGGPVEADETYVGGRRKNMGKAKRATLNGRGTAGKSVVIGVKNRGTNEARAKVISSTDEATTYRGLAGKRLRYSDLIADNGLASGVRP